mgnify:CR=1 FL=1
MDKPYFGLLHEFLAIRGDNNWRVLRVVGLGLFNKVDLCWCLWISIHADTTKSSIGPEMLVLVYICEVMLTLDVILKSKAFHPPNTVYEMIMSSKIVHSDDIDGFLFQLL